VEHTLGSLRKQAAACAGILFCICGANQNEERIRKRAEENLAMRDHHCELSRKHQTTDLSSEDLFVHMTELLDARSRRDWEDAISATSEPPSFNDLKDFLERRLHTLEALHPTKSETNAKVIDGTARSARSHLARK